MGTRIAGVLPVLNTPFLDEGTIDWSSLEREVDWAFQEGAQGVTTGMVSELLRLRTAERIELTERLVKLSANRGPVIAGIGAESIEQALEFGRCAESAGCGAVMAIPPISCALPASALREYFGILAEQIDLPLIVQDASSYVGQPIPIEVCVQLLDRFGPEKILFKPEAAPLGPNLSALRDASNGRARIFEGSGGIALVDGYRRGIEGTMPGTEFLPAIVALWRALERGDEPSAYRLYFPLCALVALQMQAGLDGFLAVEKYVLHKRGLFRTEVRRRPYNWELDSETRHEVDRLLACLDEAVAACAGSPPTS